MSRVLLQNMVEDIPDDSLPTNWLDFDFAFFSKEKILWDHQRNALRNALKLLWKYYDDFMDYQPHEMEQANVERKRLLWQWYLDNGLHEDFSVDLSRLKYRVASLLREYYEADSENKLSYENFINRMSFWMATGSGKTLVLIKLIELLWRLIRRGEIPPNDILVLTHRDDLIEQLKRHVDEFNQNRSDFRIILRELREYAQSKRETTLFRDRDVTVFYYRSDNLSDEQKEKIVDFRNYDNNGYWYVLLDEAHKGDKEESKRQHIYSILSRNGFLFNFSATFTDPRDIATTVFNFNLERFIQKGYGKHIAILKQEMRTFRDREDYTNEEKQKVVLKALMMLAYVRKIYEVIRNVKCGLYHKPLLLVLVNSVNTEDADLLLFFRELVRIGKGDISDKLWQQAKEELSNELREHPKFMFEEERIEIDEEIFQNLNYADILRWIFNSEGSGEIEVLIRPSNRQEMAFKLKNAEQPFALIKIGDISKWLKDKLTGYEINERFEDESYFAKLNEDDSAITILMGSRTFYEGWDSNRPNVICYINIGVGEDARKFILQSIGRGVRIEPMKNRRKRLRPLYNAGEVSKELFDELKNKVQPLETLFIFGTNRQALQAVLETLPQEREKTGEQQLTLFDVNPEANERLLLIPIYRKAMRPFIEVHRLAKFEVNQSEWEVMKQLVQTTDDRVLLMLLDASPHQVRVLRESISNPEEFYRFNEQKRSDLYTLLRQIVDFFGVVPEEVEQLKELEDEIRHYKHITVTLTDIRDLERKIWRVKQYQDAGAVERELKEKFTKGEITLDEYTEGIKRAAQMVKEESFEYNGKRIIIKHIAQHYYLPVILSEDEKVNYIRHIIRTRSEVQFINELEQYLSRPDNKFQEFDWWMFSKLDESLDEVYIPYYDPQMNRIAKFNPDFIFWLQRGKNYSIVFIDPKGIEHRDPDRKIEGYKQVYEQNSNTKVFQYDELQVRVFCFMWTTDLNRLPEGFGYSSYWVDNIDKVLENVIQNT